MRGPAAATLPLRGVRPPSAISRDPTGRSRVALTAPGDMQRLLMGLTAAAIIVVGTALGSSPVSLAGIGLALVCAVFSPATGLVVLAVVGPLKPPLVIPPPGLPPTLVAAILIGCLGRLAVERPTLRVGAPLFFAAAFFLYLFAQQVPEMLQLWAGAEGYRTVSLFIQIATGFGAALATALVMRGRPVGTMLVALGVGAGMAAVLAIAVMAGVSSPLIDNLVNEMQITGRAIGPFLDPNYFGTFLATATVLLMASWPLARTLLTRAALVGVTGLLLVALATTLSRGAFLALATGILVLALSIGRRLAILIMVIGVAGAAIAYPLFLEYRLSEDVGSTGLAAYAQQAASDESRVYAAAAGLDLFLSSPVFGIGLGQYKDATIRIAETPVAIESHNWYMNVLAEQGLVGIVLWVGLVGSVAVAAWRRGGLAARVGLALLATMAAGAISLQTPASYQVSSIVAIGLAMALVALWDPVRLPDGAGVTDQPHAPSVSRRPPGRRTASWG
ncbi:MAG: O-antigen ligase family protein [Chloroflexota bacterium]